MPNQWTILFATRLQAPKGRNEITNSNEGGRESCGRCAGEDTDRPANPAPQQSLQNDGSMPPTSGRIHRMRTTRRTFLGQVGAAAAIVLRAQRAAGFAQGAAPAAAPALIRSADSGRARDRPVPEALCGPRRADREADASPAWPGNIPPAMARQVCMTPKDKLVTPGLIDMHTHVYRYGITLSVDSDIVGFQNGVTTVLDCGSTGSGTFHGAPQSTVMESRADTHLRAAEHLLDRPGRDQRDLSRSRHDQRANLDCDDREQSRSDHGRQSPDHGTAQRPGARPRRHEDGARGRRCRGPPDHDAFGRWSRTC